MRITRRGFLGTAALAPAQVTGGKLRAGAAEANITPLLGCSLAGNMTDHLATDVHDELHVRAIALDNGRARIAIAQVDSCVVPRDIFDRAKAAIRTHTGMAPEAVLLSATHSHSAPASAHLFQSMPDPKYTDWLALRIADCVRMALNRLGPARIGWAAGSEPRLVFNRRFLMKRGTIPPDPFGRTTDRVQMNPPVGSPNIVEPAGPVDPAVGVLAVETPDGRPIAVLGNYALHYVGGTGAGHISADYFGAWSEAMVRLAGTPVIATLSNGCSGNINGVNFRGKPVRLPPYVQMRRYAEMLAAECWRTWRTIEFQDDVDLGGSIEELELALRLPNPEETAAAKKALAAAPPPYKDRSQIYARETVILANEYPKTVKTPVQALRIGDLGIAALPGEAFVELGLELKSRSPFRTTFAIELANDYRGYIPTVEAHELGGYETWRAKSSCLEKEAAPKLVRSALGLLGKLA
jgi:hypothetical protein